MTDSPSRSVVHDPRPIPAGRRVGGRLRVPPSKSVSNRYLALALLGRVRLVLEHPLDSEDIRLFLGALEACGFRVRERRDAERLRAVDLEPGALPAEAEIFCGASGTMLRFLVGVLSALPGRWSLDGVPRLRERPVGPLARALEGLGARFEWAGREGYAPLSIRGGRLQGGRTRLDAGSSSQYLSALLMAALAAEGPVEVEVEELTSEPYVALTEDAVAAFGGEVERPGPGLYRVVPHRPAADRLEVEGDWSAAAYPLAAAALTGGEVELEGLGRDSRQGDRGFLALLQEMGLEAAWDGGLLRAVGGSLRAVRADLGAMPDQVPTLAALAPFARGVTRIGGVPHLRLKESDRLAAMAAELTRAGAEVEEGPDHLIIPGVWAGEGSPPPGRPVILESHGDHRIAMACALVGLRRPGVSVAHPEVVTKSYPLFWSDLDRLLDGGFVNVGGGG